MQDLSSKLARYDQARTIGKELSGTLGDHIPRSMLMAAAGKLGMRKGKLLVFDSEDESNVLFDYCIHCMRRNGRNIIQQVLREGVFAPGSDEDRLLLARAQSRYTLFSLGATVAEGVVHIRDVLSGGDLSLIDRASAATFGAQQGLIVAGRLVAIDDWCMTTGAVLPVVDGARRAVHDVVRKFMPRVTAEGRLPPGPEAVFAASVIRILHRERAATQVAYA